MLASLLPGLRDVRTPLAVGYLWIAFTWLAFAPQIRAAAEHQVLIERARTVLDAAGGPSIAVGVLSFAAYVLGVLVTAPPDLPGVSQALAGLRPWYDIETQDSYARARQNDQNRITDALGQVELSDDELWTLDALATYGAPVQRELESRLLVANQELYGEYDRLKAEGVFRTNLGPPLVALAILLTVTTSAWWLLVVPLIVLLIRQGANRINMARDVLMRACLQQTIQHPATETAERLTERAHAATAHARSLSAWVTYEYETDSGQDTVSMTALTLTVHLQNTGPDLPLQITSYTVRATVLRPETNWIEEAGSAQFDDFTAGPLAPREEWAQSVVIIPLDLSQPAASRSFRVLGQVEVWLIDGQGQEWVRSYEGHLRHRRDSD